MKKSFSLFSIVCLMMSSLGFTQAWAILTPSASNAMLELKFESSFSDTSPAGRFITTKWDVALASGTWAIPPSANFSGSGQINASLSWNALETSPFTISYWIKAPVASRANDQVPITECPNYSDGYLYHTTSDYIRVRGVNGASPTVISYNTVGQIGLTAGCYLFSMTSKPGYSMTSVWATYYLKNATATSTQSTVGPQSIFSFRRSGGYIYDTSLYLLPDYKCRLENGMIMDYTGFYPKKEFDCTMLNDGAWHFMSIRKDAYKTLDINIDGTQVYFARDSYVTTSRYLTLGKNNFTDSMVSRFKGQIGAFRLYNSSLSDSDISLLRNEFYVAPVASDIPVITISQGNTEPAPIKTVSATTSTGSLELSVTRAETCNDTLSFEDYSDLTFSSLEDNGTRICYRATNGTKKVFKLSAAIRWITGNSSEASTDEMFGWDQSYLSWPASSVLKKWDYTRGMLVSITGIQFVDINGDGLVDILYNAGLSQGIFVNRGDYTFNPEYKCKYAQEVTGYTRNADGTQTATYGNKYYGNCADTNYR